MQARPKKLRNSKRNLNKNSLTWKQKSKLKKRSYKNNSRNRR